MSVNKGLEWTFNTQADRYEKIRPGYISELYDDIFKMKNVDANSNVIEIGIGGGQATLPILKNGCKLTAVEYGENLAKVCCEKFKDYPNFSTVVSKFEDVKFEKSSFDLIYSASAFHWIPEEIGYTKTYDMLKSGGVFARFANHPYKDKGREELWQAIQNLYAIYMPNDIAPDEYTDENAKERAEIAYKYGFVDVSHKLYHRTRSFSAKEYTELLGTYSNHIALEKSVRERFFFKVESTIEKFGGQITIYDTIDLQLAKKP